MLDEEISHDSLLIVIFLKTARRGRISCQAFQVFTQHAYFVKYPKKFIVDQTIYFKRNENLTALLKYEKMNGLH